MMRGALYKAPLSVWEMAKRKAPRYATRGFLVYRLVPLFALAVAFAGVVEDLEGTGLTQLLLDVGDHTHAHLW